jgi:hypothetical protein
LGAGRTPDVQYRGPRHSSLIHTQGVGDLYRIYLAAHRDGLDFNLAYIPTTFRQPHTADFDPEYMRPLYELRYTMAARDYPWEKTPPGCVTHCP